MANFVEHFSIRRPRVEKISPSRAQCFPTGALPRGYWTCWGPSMRASACSTRVRQRMRTRTGATAALRRANRFSHRAPTNVQKTKRAQSIVPRPSSLRRNARKGWSLRMVPPRMSELFFLSKRSSAIRRAVSQPPVVPRRRPPGLLSSLRTR